MNLNLMRILGTNVRYLFTGLLVVLFSTNYLAAKDPKNDQLVFLDANINAETSHYKTVLTTIADKETEVKITSDKKQLEKLNQDLATLQTEKSATEQQIKDLTKQYNALLKKQK